MKKTRLVGTVTAVIATALAVSSSCAHGQTISQDYARYSSMLNQERSDALKRDGQATIDATSPRNAGSGGSPAGSGGSSSRGGSSSAAPSIGMLAGTMDSMMDRHKAAAAARQQREDDARNALAQRTQQLQKASDDFLNAYDKAHPLIDDNLAKGAKGDAAALGAAGFQYLEGIGVKQDRERGRSLMADAGNKGDAISMHILAVMYYNGSHGATVDHAKAYPWFVKDAATGDVDALRTACEMAIRGDGTPVNVADGEHFCTAALAKGNASAADNLGFLYSGGVAAVKVDRAKAAAYFRRAIDLGMPVSLTNMLYMYRGGDGQPADNAAIVALVEPLAAKGDPTGEIEMGLQFYNGEGVPKDPAKCAALFQKAADQGSARAMEQLASLTETGVGIPKDPVKSLKLYRQSAVQGWGPSLYKVGMLTLRGNGVPLDRPEGIKLLRLASDNGDVNAPYVLAQAYQLGYGVDKDPVEARKWLLLGAERGDQECIDELKKR